MRIGFNAQTHEVINQNSFETAICLDHTTVQEEDLNKLPKHLEAWQDTAAAPNNQGQGSICLSLEAQGYALLGSCSALYQHAGSLCSRLYSSHLGWDSGQDASQQGLQVGNWGHRNPKAREAYWSGEVDEILGTAQYISQESEGCSPDPSTCLTCVQAQRGDSWESECSIQFCPGMVDC